MTTQEVAQRLVSQCSLKEFVAAQEELYATDIVRIETDGKQIQGIENTLAFEKKFLDSVTVNSCEMSAPLIAGDYFTVVMKVDLTFNNGLHSGSEEICVYKVESGKIVFEQFFRSPAPVRP